MTNDDDPKQKPLEGELVPPEKEGRLSRRSASRPLRLPFLNRMTKRAVESERDLVKAEEELAEAQVRHRRALHKLDNIEGVLAIDDVRLFDEFESSARRARLGSLSDEVTEKELRLRLRELDGRLEAKPEKKQKPPSRLERLREKVLGDAKLAANLEQETKAEIERIRAQMERGEISRERGELLIENITDRLAQILEEI